jgi:hypothetical protein
MPQGKKVWVDEYMLDELKDLFGLDGDGEAVHEAVRRIIELEETIMLLAEMARLQQIPEEWEQDPDAWRHRS